METNRTSLRIQISIGLRNEYIRVRTFRKIGTRVIFFFFFFLNPNVKERRIIISSFKLVCVIFFFFFYTLFSSRYQSSHSQSQNSSSNSLSSPRSSYSESEMREAHAKGRLLDARMNGLTIFLIKNTERTVRRVNWTSPGKIFPRLFLRASAATRLPFEKYIHFR